MLVHWENTKCTLHKENADDEGGTKVTRAWRIKTSGPEQRKTCPQRRMWWVSSPPAVGIV